MHEKLQAMVLMTIEPCERLGSGIDYVHSEITLNVSITSEVKGIVYQFCH